MTAGCGTATGEPAAWRDSDRSRPSATAGGSAAASPTGRPSRTPTATGSPRPRGPQPTGGSTRPASATPRPPSGRYVFPVTGQPVSYAQTHAGYPATDIFAPCGRPVLAVTDGVVLEVSRVDRFDPRRPDGALKGGLFVSVRGDDGVRYYGSHFTRVAAGVAAGIRVRAGQQLGTVGHTGDASKVCHLHFGISPPCAGAGDWWIRRGAVWPGRFLDAWRAGRSVSPASAVADYRAAHGCPPAPTG
ncbi:MAG TPA: M23 family metallopeptidase [Pilimelia sp.]|nr:M23 family metallopeptidase [Pilimelia sp.]